MISKAYGVNQHSGRPRRAGTCCSVSGTGCRLKRDVVRQLKAIEANHLESTIFDRHFSIANSVAHRVKTVLCDQ
jgi:hypothetical protein